MRPTLQASLVGDQLSAERFGRARDCRAQIGGAEERMSRRRSDQSGDLGLNVGKTHCYRPTTAGNAFTQSVAISRATIASGRVGSA